MDEFSDFSCEEFLRETLGFRDLVSLHDVLNLGERKEGKEFEVFLNVFVCCTKEELGRKFSCMECRTREWTLPGRTLPRLSSFRPTTPRSRQISQTFHPYL